MPREDKQREKQGTAPYAKPHMCLYCTDAFGNKSNLTRHVRTVHEKRRDHVCPHCQQAFSRAGHLRQHIQNVHQ